MGTKVMIFFRFSSIVQAVGYGLATYFLIYRLIARGDVLITYLLNLVFIIIALNLDKVARKFANRRASDIRIMYSEMGIVHKAIYLLSQGFFKTALYYFYIAVLVIAQVTIARPNILPVELSGFFTSIEYGILLLFAIDRLKEMLVSDKQWIADNLKM